MVSGHVLVDCGRDGDQRLDIVVIIESNDRVFGIVVVSVKEICGSNHLAAPAVTSYGNIFLIQNTVKGISFILVAGQQ